MPKSTAFGGNLAWLTYNVLQYRHAHLITLHRQIAEVSLLAIISAYTIVKKLPEICTCHL